MLKTYLIDNIEICFDKADFFLILYVPIIATHEI